MMKGISYRNAWMLYYCDVKGMSMCLAVCGAHSMYGPIADLRRGKALCEKSTLYTVNVTRDKTACS